MFFLLFVVGRTVAIWRGAIFSEGILYEWLFNAAVFGEAAFLQLMLAIIPREVIEIDLGDEGGGNDPPSDDEPPTGGLFLDQRA